MGKEILDPLRRAPAGEDPLKSSIMIHDIGERIHNWDPAIPEGLHYNYANDVHSLLFIFDGIRNEEIEDFRYAPIEFGLRIEGGLIVLIVQVGSLGPGNAYYNWWSNMAQRRTIPGAEHGPREEQTVSLHLIDRAAGVIRGTRNVRWSAGFSRRLEEEIRRQATHPEYAAPEWSKGIVRGLEKEYPNPGQLMPNAVAKCFGSP